MLELYNVTNLNVEFMKRKLMLCFSLFFLGIGIITAQTQVRGTVVDEIGEPVIGATILIKGTSQGTVTDIVFYSPFVRPLGLVFKFSSLSL